VAHATVKPARIRFHSPDLDCDVSRRIGWTVRYPDGERGKIHRTRDEARQEARSDTSPEPGTV